ncbi:MAG: hypothetical protein RL383_799 [Actinomycetota bacterium]
MDIRIGITQSPREISIEVEDDPKKREALKSAVEQALAGKVQTLWLTDKKGRDVAIPAEKIAFVEIGSDQSGPKIGFGG